MGTTKNFVVIIVLMVLANACHKKQEYDPLVNTYKMDGGYDMSGYCYSSGSQPTGDVYFEYITVISRDTISSTRRNNAYFHFISSDLGNNTITFLYDWTSNPFHDTIVYNYSTGKLRHATMQGNTWCSWSSQ